MELGFHLLLHQSQAVILPLLRQVVENKDGTLARSALYVDNCGSGRNGCAGGVGERIGSVRMEDVVSED